MSYANLTGTSIRRATVRGVQLDDIAARCSTERLLGRIPDAVPGMSASAILCVRELSIRVRSKPRYMQPSGSVLHDEMEQLARRAARPAHGPVPSHAEAVLFADRAELLTCLARDHVRHLLEQHWWWRVLLPGANLGAAAVQLYVNEAAHVPEALARLAQSHDAIAFVRNLRDSDADALVQAIVRIHGLSLLAETLAIAAPMQSRAQPISPEPAGFRRSDTQKTLRPLEEEIRSTFPEAWIHGLSVIQRRLLVLGLSLVRMPGRVRSAAYAQVLSALLEEAAKQYTCVERNETATGRVTNLQGSPVLRASFESKRATISHPENVRGAGRWLPDTGNFCRPDTGSVPDLPTATPRTRGTSTLSGGPLPPTALLPSRTLPPAAHPIAAHNDAEMQHQAQAVETEYGGVFFLSNAALALGLYADFTRPLERGLELSFWDFLALAAVDLGGPAVRSDPLWPLLANLAGRKPGQRPGADFDPPREWRMPPDWLLPFSGDAADWTWAVDDTRLVVLHPAGFVVLDLPRTETSAEEQLHVELALYEVIRFRRETRCPRSPVMPLARWRSWVMPYLGRRMALALGDASWRRACRQLLSLPGRIECDAERLEVHFSLERLPVAVRVAGLDRDPGWIPAAGRDLRFYFECDHA
jgi:hypothetical protein